MAATDASAAGVVRPADPGFEAATRVFNLSAPPAPAAAVVAITTEDVRAAVRYAAASGLPVRILDTGHAAAAVRPADHALLVRTELRGDVQIEPARAVARITAGTRWGAVVAAATRHGLAAPHGSSPTVGVVGYLLGGGMSSYGRYLGLAANHIHAIELVTADGQLRRVDARSDPELFWAIRGGGGGFGVVTAVEVALFPAVRVTSGAAYWEGQYAGQLLARWQEWARQAPRQATTSIRVMNLPPVAGVPEVLAGRFVVAVDGAVLSVAGDTAGARRHAEELLGPLRAVARPLLDTWRLGTPGAVLEAHMDPPEPVPFRGDHMLLRDLGDDGLAALLSQVGEGSKSPLTVAGLRQLGGAYADSPPGGGVLDHLTASFSYAGSGAPLGVTTIEQIVAHCAKVRAAMAPWDTGLTVPSFVEDYRQPQRHLTPAQVREVDRVRVRVDPDGLFRDDVAPNATALR